MYLLWLVLTPTDWDRPHLHNTSTSVFNRFREAKAVDGSYGYIMLCDYDYENGVVGYDAVVVVQCETWQKLICIMFPLRNLWNRETRSNKKAIYKHREKKKMSEFSPDSKWRSKFISFKFGKLWFQYWMNAQKNTHIHRLVLFCMHEWNKCNVGAYK